MIMKAEKEEVNTQKERILRERVEMQLYSADISNRGTSGSNLGVKFGVEGSRGVQKTVEGSKYIQKKEGSGLFGCGGVGSSQVQILARAKSKKYN